MTGENILCKQMLIHSLSLQLMRVRSTTGPTKKDDLTNWLTYTVSVSFSQKCPYMVKSPQRGSSGHLHIMSYYAPTIPASREEKDEFFDSPQQALSAIPSEENNVVLVISMLE